MDLPISSEGKELVIFWQPSLKIKTSPNNSIIIILNHFIGSISLFYGCNPLVPKRESVLCKITL